MEGVPKVEKGIFEKNKNVILLVFYNEYVRRK